MEKVGLAELKNSLSSYIERVTRGGSFVVTDHNRPVAKLTPFNIKEATSNEERIAALLASASVQCSEPYQKLEKAHTVKLGGVSAAALLVKMRE